MDSESTYEANRDLIQQLIDNLDGELCVETRHLSPQDALAVKMTTLTELMAQIMVMTIDEDSFDEAIDFTAARLRTSLDERLDGTKEDRSNSG